jgi:DNA-binding transcriptional LysR family regulator
VVASKQRLAKKRQISLEDIRHEEIIGVRPQVAPGRFRTFIAACRSLGFSPRIVHIASSFPELIMAVKKRMGVTILGSLAASAPHPGVVFIKLNPRVPLDIHAAHTLHGTPAALHLVELIVAEARRATEVADIS